MTKIISVQPKFHSRKRKGETPMDKYNGNWRKINKIIEDQSGLHPIGCAGSMCQLQLKSITDDSAVMYPKIQ